MSKGKCIHCGHCEFDHSYKSLRCPSPSRKAVWADTHYQVLSIRPEWVNQLEAIAIELESIACDLDELHPKLATRCRALLSGQEAVAK